MGEQGEFTNVDCPRCGGPIVYNGNYFCDNWAYPPNPALGECDWVLSHDDETGDPIGETDQRIWDELKQRYPALRYYLTIHPEEDR